MLSFDIITHIIENYIDFDTKMVFKSTCNSMLHLSLGELPKKYNNTITDNILKL